jgi:hypothetical protein
MRASMFLAPLLSVFVIHDTLAAAMMNPLYHSSLPQCDPMHNMLGLQGMLSHMIVSRDCSHSTIRSLHSTRYSFVKPTDVGGARTIIKDSHQGLLPNEKSAFAAGKLFATPRGYDTENKPSHEVLNKTLTRIRFGRYDPL